MKRPGLFNKYHLSKWALILVLVFLQTTIAHTQKIEERLPFRMANNLIILSAKINGSDSLSFILDTGLKNSIICEHGERDALDLVESHQMQVVGLGDGNPTDAIHSSGNILEVGGLNFSEQDFIVISENILQLSHKMGTRVHGMLSMSVFYDYVVEIDYQRRHISFTSPESYKLHNSNKYSSIPFLIESGKPFLEITIIGEDGRSYPVKLLLDSGASNAIWLDINSMEGFLIPERKVHTYLGSGISGNLQGTLCRVKQVKIGDYSLNDVLVSFPDSMSIAQQEQVPGRNGSIGSEILKRFDVIIDFPEKLIHLRPNRSFKQKFNYDMSGIEVMAEVPDQPIFVVTRVREGSPAYNAGIRTGDMILSINNVSVYDFSMDDIYKRFVGPEGKNIKMVILRADEKIKLNFVLEDFI